MEIERLRSFRRKFEFKLAYKKTTGNFSQREKFNLDNCIVTQDLHVTQ